MSELGRTGCNLCYLSLAQSANLKIRAAAAVDPNPVPVVTPSSAVDAVGVTALADESYPAIGIDRAHAASHILGRAIDDLDAGSTRLPAATAATTSANLEICAASPIDPDAAGIVSPRTAEVARRAADLPNDAHAAARVGGAHIASTVVGRAINVVTIVPPAPARAASLEIGLAAAVHPDPTAVHIAPRLVEDARSVTALLDELHATPDIGGAVISPHIVGGAGDELPLGRTKAGCRGLRRVSQRDRNGQDGCQAEGVSVLIEGLTKKVA
jgi:hypothetical protein